jgi:hypothetical protein
VDAVPDRGARASGGAGSGGAADEPTATAVAEAGRWLRSALSAVLADEQDLARVAGLRRWLHGAVARLP